LRLAGKSVYLGFVDEEIERVEPAERPLESARIGRALTPCALSGRRASAPVRSSVIVRTDRVGGAGLPSSGLEPPVSRS